LSEIKNLTPTSTVLSQNDYTYDAVGKILTWQQQTDSTTPLLWTEGYDAADQLTSALLTNTAITSPPVFSDNYAYDPAGNATTLNNGTVSRSPTYNNLNQLTGSTPSGSQTVQFTGALNETSTVTVNGTAATVSGINFSGGATLAPGSTNTVAVVAQDSHGNTRTNNYQTIVPPQLTYSPTFDPDGNELSNGAGQTYTWDAKNELASITYANGNSTAFTYDALERRIEILESGTTSSTKQFVWDGAQLAEERNGSNAVTKRFYAEGEQIAGSSYYYTRDHLGSVREMTDSTGAIQARYDYDPYGRTRFVQGTMASDFQYAGYYEHASSSLNLTYFRAYDPNTGKWLSRDPLRDAEMGQGPNLYEYVKNGPIRLKDPLGLCPCGQHFGFNFGAFSDTVDTMTGDGVADAAGDINFGMKNIDVEWWTGEAVEEGSLDVAEELDPYLLGYSVAVDLGAGLGSWVACQTDRHRLRLFRLMTPTLGFLTVRITAFIQVESSNCLCD
jgi:RHS repeat-associated protein